MFSAFKSAIEEQVGEEEYQAHYDLGIAYREMGLLEDAIREFEQACKGRALCVEALILVGSCKVEAGRAGEAIRDLDRALGMAEEGSEAHLALRYERAHALAACGKRDEALEEFRRVQEASPDYREVDERIAELEE